MCRMHDDLVPAEVKVTIKGQKHWWGNGIGESYQQSNCPKLKKKMLKFWKD